ncbi:uncharacterized protein LOC141660336 [Apium graveolens]|uniref:uncharacterized protein LOC141660336 n=1 Tax=Apium graveolens TaxID=4045 RepID=UPI003D79D369
MATKVHNSGRKKIQVAPNAITNINMGDRSCIRDLAAKLNVSSSTSGRMIKRDDIKPHTNPLHPRCKEPNMLQMMEWVLDLLMGDTAQTKRFNAQGEWIFDGTLGILSFTYQEPAKRSYKYRGKGTIITKVVKSVGRKETRNMLINQIVPAIIQKWPPSEGPKVIFIQQDNVGSHISQTDEEWQQVHQ